MIRWLPIFLLAALAACAPASAPSSPFWQNLQALCGGTYGGVITSRDSQEDDWRRVPLVMTVETCTDTEIRVPFAVGEDTSRTWVLTRTDAGLLLRHDHKAHDPARPDVTDYGGLATPTDSETRRDFPVDAHTRAIFEEAGFRVSLDNVWTIEVDPDAALFAYELTRPGRHVRVEFDTATSVDPASVAPTEL